MEPITSSAELKKAIQRLEVEQALKGQILKDQFQHTDENLKPLNLLKRAVTDMADSPFLIENILANALVLLSGFLSKKIVIGSAAKSFRKLSGRKQH